MSNDLAIFENTNFGQVRIIPEDDTFWVVGKDVLKALDYAERSDPNRTFASIPDEWKGTKPIRTPGGTQQMLCLSEQGLYFFLGRSDKPKALPYQKWIAGEVFPNIHSKKTAIPAVPVEINNTNSDVQSFENTQFGKIRVIMKNGDPWFVAKDVCECLGLDQISRAISNLDTDEKADLTISTLSLNGTKQARNVNIISESGLYSLVLRSRKPEAKQFKRWITHEVLPSIRKTGSYSTQPIDGIRLANAIEQLNNKIDALSEQVQEMVPKAKFYDLVTQGENQYDFIDVTTGLNGEGYNIGRNKLFEILRDRGVLMKDNRPYRRFVQNGMFKRSICGDTVTLKTVTTGKGLQYIKKLLDDLS